MNSLFDPAQFGERVLRKMERERLSFREAARAIGTDHCNVQRVTTGKAPSVETYLRIVRWLDGH